MHSQIENQIRVEKNQAAKEIKESKEVENIKIRETWFGSVKSYIKSKVRPFSYGLLG